MNGTPTWCIFDNTASGAATADALRLMDLMQDAKPSPATNGQLLPVRP
ncbi:hypothetical protein [Pseudomonas sp. Pdm06]|nr:hypothetical protein [Pseudomonas sp. Pdm06]MBD9465289.1 hypothetical protein [Pseudomonas sp. Pdm06]